MAWAPRVRTSWALPCWALTGFLSPLLAHVPPKHGTPLLKR